MILRFFSALALILMTSCGGSIELVEDPPFAITKAEKKGLGGKGFSIFFKTAALPREVAFKDLYFSTYKANVLWEKEHTYYANFPTTLGDGERILSSDMSKEANNPIPILPVEVPYPIKENEALLEYTLGEESYFTIFKID